MEVIVEGIMIEPNNVLNPCILNIYPPMTVRPGVRLTSERRVQK
jgi:hypothetical protein